MKYTEYQCEDFVADSYFRQWVKRPDEESSSYWQHFLTLHPQQAPVVAQAAELVRSLSAATADASMPVDAAEKSVIWNAIREKLVAEQARTSVLLPTRPLQPNWNWLAVAATIVLVVGIGWWFGVNSPGELVLTRQPEVALSGANLITKSNTTTHAKLIVLPDGSSLLLQKGSQIRYSSSFDEKRRIVHLTGEAFFEVAKDPSHPFFVYANGLVTKVLGTSFNVQAYAEDDDVVVRVRSGRVAVFAQSDENRQRKTNSPALEGVVLSPNEQIVFARQPVRLAKPTGIAPATAQNVFVAAPDSFAFNATPVHEVFSQLEKAYGIPIVYDKETLGRCRLTADLTDEPLPEKMLIVCKSIEASYQIDETRIVVSGPGCRP